MSTSLVIECPRCDYGLVSVNDDGLPTLVACPTCEGRWLCIPGEDAYVRAVAWAMDHEQHIRTIEDVMA